MNLPIPENADMQQREQTYIWFVRGVTLFAVHAVLILAVLGYVLSGDMG